MSNLKDDRRLPYQIHSELDDYGLDPYQFRVYARIVRRAGRGECIESVANMATGCRMSGGKVKDCLKFLLDHRFITRHSRPGRSSSYRLTDMSLWIQPGHVATQVEYDPGCESSNAGHVATQVPGHVVATKESLKGSPLRTLPPTPHQGASESAAVDDGLELPDHATNFPGQVEPVPHLQTIDEVAWQRAYSENKPQQWRPCPISLAVPNTREAIKAAIAATGAEETALEYFGQALAWVAKHETDPFWTKPGHSFTSLINPKSLKFLELAASYQSKVAKPAQARYVAMPYEPMAVVAAKRDVGLAATRGEDWRNVG